MLERFDPAKVADEFTARFNQNQALAAEKVKLADEFKLARPEVLDARYQTPEEFRAAVQSSHDAEAAHREQMRQEVESEMFARLKEQHGLDLAPAPQAPAAEGKDGSVPQGPTTIEDLNRLSPAEYLALPDDVIERIERQAFSQTA